MVVGKHATRPSLVHTPSGPLMRKENRRHHNVRGSLEW